MKVTWLLSSTSSSPCLPFSWVPNKGKFEQFVFVAYSTYIKSSTQLKKNKSKFVAYPVCGTCDLPDLEVMYVFGLHCVVFSGYPITSFVSVSYVKGIVCFFSTLLLLPEIWSIVKNIVIRVLINSNLWMKANSQLVWEVKQKEFPLSGALIYFLVFIANLFNPSVSVFVYFFSQGNVNRVIRLKTVQLLNGYII